MRVTIFGATGKTGTLLVEQALAAGHQVRAFARTPAKLNLQSDRLTVVEGDINDPAAVERAVAGADAVISVLGPSSNNDELAITRGTRHILAAMQKCNVKRLIVTSGAGVRDPEDQPGLFDNLIVTVLKLVNKNVYEDMVAVVNLVRQSDRDWTVVRVPMLTDNPPVGKIRAGAVGKDIGTRIGRADMSAFILQQLEDKRYLRQAPAISN